MSRSSNATAAALSRRQFVHRAVLAAAAAAPLLPGALAAAAEVTTLPFDNGERPLVKYPQKRPLMRLTTRPPQLETPFAVFNEGILTPNDAFFVRYHLTISPPPMTLLEKFQLEIKGNVKTPLTLSVADLKSKFEPVEVVAVNQCSGNSRGFSEPRVSGGQVGHGSMGNARWRGVRLKDVLDQAGVGAGAKQVTFRGLDRALVKGTPEFIKALDVDHARDGEVMLAYEMNGEPLPVLNGWPLRLVVPGHYGTYWIKHVNEITVIDEVFSGFWMGTAYRIPDNASGCIAPGTAPGKTVPIMRFNVRSFITSLVDGSTIKTGQPLTVRGIAFDSGHGISEVIFSDDGGRSWHRAELGKDLGKYSFREWTINFTPPRAGLLELKVKATNRIGQSQPLEPLWNPAGYLRNVVETVRVNAA